MFQVCAQWDEFILRRVWGSSRARRHLRERLHRQVGRGQVGRWAGGQVGRWQVGGHEAPIGRGFTGRWAGSEPLGLGTLTERQQSEIKVQ